MMVRGSTPVSLPLQIPVPRCNMIVLSCLWLIPLHTLLYLVYKFYLEYNNFFYLQLMYKDWLTTRSVKCGGKEEKKQCVIRSIRE